MSALSDTMRLRDHDGAYRTRPSAEDPLAQRPSPTSLFDAFSAVVDERIEQRMRGRTTDTLNSIPDTALVLELLARGWAVYRPQAQPTVEIPK